MSDLTHPPHKLSPQIHLNRAKGYFQLEMFDDVEVELRAVEDILPWSKEKREILTFLYQERKEWELMQHQARSLRIEFIDEEDWWVSEAYATRRAKGIIEARDILLEGLAIHQESSIIRYNLACYACQLGDLDETLDFLKEAVERDEKYKLIALDDEDLEKVRKTLIQLGWDKVAV